MTGTDWPGQTN